MGLFDKLFGSYSDKEIKRLNPIVDKVLALEPQFAALSDDELRHKTVEFKTRYQNSESLDKILPEAFACCREASARVLGMKHYPVQILGGIVLHQGRIAEMKTGEGKTLVATLPCYLNAITGEGVHVVTVNDYLAKRDSEWMGNLYRFLGLSIGLIQNGMDAAARKENYAADITYCTNNELGFDYLRDNMAVYKENQVQRGHAFAIVDEVDSILIDEARTPLIISGRGEKSSELYALANNFAKTLTAVKVVEINKKEDTDSLFDGDYIIDEKARSATLTADGIKKAEKYFNIENLTDPENSQLAHHINQAIKAVGIMQRDVDYVINDNKIVIVDEFTGRLMIGRRYNEGLHQAIEAKEGVVVEHESRTLATITFQNLFRMYKKLAGMTGTALTEEEEFRSIYKLDVLEIPTNKPIQRVDYDDSIYQTEAAKYAAVAAQVDECHKKGQPVLVGTVSIEKSEHISKMLGRMGVKHEVLNAKQHDREAQIVAQAGKFGAVTIATNMAGRGTDIMLGGNAEYMAKSEMRRQGCDEEQIYNATSYAQTDDEEITALRAKYKELLQSFKDEINFEAQKVKEAGGLFIIGTERHDSRRIDNQLRGRSGRQGDIGYSRFYLSLEDDLMRLFGGEKVKAMAASLKVEEDMPLEAKMLTGVIASAQGKVESRNFSTRKNVLQFDDVMNHQRELIYAQRGRVLNNEDIGAIIEKMVTDTVGDIAERYIGISENPEEWNLEGLAAYYAGWLITPEDVGFTPKDWDAKTRGQITADLTELAQNKYAAKKANLPAEVVKEIEQLVLLRNVDEKWMNHIDNMDALRRGIYLRSYGQKDPVVEYRIEGADMFDEMIESIREDTVKMLFTFKVNVAAEPKREQVATPTELNVGGDQSVKKEPIRAKKKVGPNDPCPCGSGLKYKKCHGK